MAWSEQWSYKVDGGIELNDGSAYNTQIPQIDDVPDWDTKTVPIDGTYPSYIRADPTAGAYTVLVQFYPCDWATYQTRLGVIKGIFSMGASHTLAFQARGMVSAKSVLIVPRGIISEPKLRKLVINCFVPVPVPA